MKLAFHEPNYEYSPFGVPRLPGVYVVSVAKYDPDTLRIKKTKAVYIGSSKDMHRRIMSTSHVYRKLYDKLHHTHCVAVACLITDDYLIEEKRMIMKYRPKLNKQFNGIQI